LGALLLFASPSAQAEETLSFDGNWQGLIFFDKETFLAETSTPTAGQTFRLEIHGDVVRVFIVASDGAEESKPGAYHIAAVSANAVIYATTSSINDDGEGWVESWAFVVTRKNSDTLVAQYVRLVNNVHLAPDEKESKFAARGAGELKLVTTARPNPPPVKPVAPSSNRGGNI
jgi:hypothetical protein